MNKPRVYKHSNAQLLAVIVVFGLLLAGAIFWITQDSTMLVVPFIAIFILIILGFLFSLRAKTIISDDQISTQSFLGTKTLRWSEITRVSGSGYAIKLHNFDGDVTVAPSPQLPGYEEIVEWIGAKRPDLFNPQEYSEMKKSWTGYILLAFVALFFVGMGFFALTQSNGDFASIIFFFIIGIVIASTTIFSPQALTIEGNSLTIKYLFNQKTMRADEIKFINLRFAQSRNGKNYFILLTLANGKSIRVSGIKPNLPAAYLVLKNWHKKNAPSGQTNY